jgi:hypothetical protein
MTKLSRLPLQGFSIIFISRIPKHVRIKVTISDGIWRLLTSLYMETDVHFNLYQETGYSQQRYKVAAIHLQGPLSSLKKPSSFALLPRVQTTYSRISRMLFERKMFGFLGPVTDDLQLNTPGCVHPSPASVCQVCIGLVVPWRLV